MRLAFRAFLAAAALVLFANFAGAAELVMVDMRACPYCAKFRSEVAPTYETTEVGKIAPLRTVSALKKWPDDLAQVQPAPYTPVFILVENGQEVGRFAGYTSAADFWSQLKPLIARL